MNPATSDFRQEKDIYRSTANYFLINLLETLQHMQEIVFIYCHARKQTTLRWIEKHSPHNDDAPMEVFSTA